MKVVLCVIITLFFSACGGHVDNKSDADAGVHVEDTTVESGNPVNITHGYTTPLHPNVVLAGGDSYDVESNSFYAPNAGVYTIDVELFVSDFMGSTHTIYVVVFQGDEVSASSFDKVFDSMALRQMLEISEEFYLDIGDRVQVLVQSNGGGNPNYTWRYQKINYHFHKGD